MKSPNMMWRATDEVAKAIHDERVNGCPYEGWGGLLWGIDGEISDARVVDNQLVLEIEFGPDSTHETGRFELVLKPTEWKRAAPKKRKRQRAKDLRARRRR